MTAIIDDFSPIYTGDTGAPFNAQFLYKNGLPVDLTGATISMIMESSGGCVKAASGTWTIMDAVNGRASYAYASSDVNTADTWTLYIAISIGGRSVHADTKILKIEPVPLLDH